MNDTRTISIPSLAFNYVNNRIESIGCQGELYYRERGAHVPHCDTRWHELFGTPERAAQTLANLFANCNGFFCLAPEPEDASYDALLEWLRGDA